MISIDTLEKVLSPKEMKNVTGGSYDGPWCCAYNNSGGDGGICLNGGGSPIEAEFMAGANGWWACNSQEVISNCCS